MENITLSKEQVKDLLERIRKARDILYELNETPRCFMSKDLHSRLYHSLDDLDETVIELDIMTDDEIQHLGQKIADKL